VKKRAPLVATLALLAATALGCSDDGGDGGGGDKAADQPPTNASTADFCGAFEDLITELSGLGADAQPAEAVGILKGAGSDLAEIGTPEGMPEDARSGFELVLEEIEGLDDNATKEDINNLGADISEAQDADMQAYQGYLRKTCADQLGGGAG
jgi:hypothetical protein